MLIGPEPKLSSFSISKWGASSSQPNWTHEHPYHLSAHYRNGAKTDFTVGPLYETFLSNYIKQLSMNDLDYQRYMFLFV